MGDSRAGFQSESDSPASNPPTVTGRSSHRSEASNRQEIQVTGLQEWWLPMKIFNENEALSASYPVFELV